MKHPLAQSCPVWHKRSADLQFFWLISFSLSQSLEDSIAAEAWPESFFTGAGLEERPETGDKITKDKQRVEFKVFQIQTENFEMMKLGLLKLNSWISASQHLHETSKQAHPTVREEEEKLDVSRRNRNALIALHPPTYSTPPPFSPPTY